MHFSTSNYHFTHGRNPRGRGHWAFDIGGEVVWAMDQNRNMTLTYSEAKRAVTPIAKAAGITSITVLT